MYFNTITPVDLGVNSERRPTLIQPGQWVTMQQLRAFRGTIRNFPGWLSILDPSSTHLTAPCTLIDELVRYDGTRFLIVGDTSKVYLYNSLGKTLTDITGAATVAPTADDPWWSFFYQNHLYMVNKIDGLYKCDGATITKITTAPKAKVGGILADHICLFNYNDGNDHPQGFIWSALGTDDQWTALPQNDSGAFDVTESGELGVGCLPLLNDLVLYKERALVHMTYVGGNEVFARRQTINGVGLIGPYAIQDIGDEHLFMGSDNFYGYDGSPTLNSEIGMKIRDYVYPNLHPVYRNRVRSVIIEDAQEVLFMYPSNSSTGVADLCVVYNYRFGVWYGPFPIDCTMAGATTNTLQVLVEDIPDIVETIPTIVEQYPSGVGRPQTLFANGAGDLLEINDIYQGNNGVGVTRVLESGDTFLGANATKEDGSPAVMLPGAVFQVNEINTEIGDLVKDGIFQLFMGYRMELDDEITWQGPIDIDQSKHRIKTSVRGTGRWFRIKVIADNSQQFQLTGYQYGFGVVGRR